MDKVQKIRNSLVDEASIRIFEQRTDYLYTGNEESLNLMVSESKVMKKLRLVINEVYDRGCPLVFYGLGNEFGYIRKICSDLKIDAACDIKYSEKKAEWKDENVISVEELFSFKHEYCLVNCVVGSWRESTEYLIKNGVPEKNIVNLGEMLKREYSKQYFDSDIIIPRSEMVFVDGGCYDGSTSGEFVKYCKNKYDRIYAFEPDRINYEKCERNLNCIAKHKYKLFQCGLWDTTGELLFEQGNGCESKISDNATSTVSVAAIDEIVTEPVSFIKMDIEGAEKRALLGAENTIRKYRPRLAICVYHKPEDIVEIPNLILSINPDYNLYLRHYHIDNAETVLYAI